jgi:large conductance mechanosensitive channel
MGMLAEFKEFAVKGSVVDLAVGVIIGAAFGKITTSLVEDIIMPPIGMVTGRVDFTKLAVTLQAATTDATGKVVPPVEIRYGNFLSILIQFIIVAFVVFLLVKAINRAKREPVPTPTTMQCPFCLTDIPIGAKRCPACTSELS